MEGFLSVKEVVEKYKLENSNLPDDELAILITKVMKVLADLEYELFRNIVVKEHIRADGRKMDQMNKIRLLYAATALFEIGLVGMYFFHFESKPITLVTFGFAGFVMISGYILISALCGAMLRYYTPQNAAGKLQNL